MSDFLHTLSQSDDQHDIYERKYYALKRKCEEVQQVLCFDLCLVCWLPSLQWRVCNSDADSKLHILVLTKVVMQTALLFC